MATILIVEDNEMNRDMLSRRLARKGYDVLLAVDGRGGIVAARERRPDLVLMDVSLPDMTGLEASRELKNDTVTARTPIIALTAHATEAAHRAALAAGCDDFETKPIELGALLGKMERLLRATPSTVAASGVP